MKISRNPLTGRNCSGFRFRFKVEDIDPHTLYLPLELKDHPFILQLRQGISPLKVFVVETMWEARRAFRRLRKRYDFDYWALKEFFIPDAADSDSIVPLRLNDAQFHIIDILRKRYYNKEKGRYVISKSMRRCGLTTSSALSAPLFLCVSFLSTACELQPAISSIPFFFYWRRL